MIRRSTAGTRRRSLAALLGVGLAVTGVAAASPVAAADAGPTFEDGTYVVLFDGEPSTTYDGGIAGYAATKAANGQGFVHGRGVVKKYEQYLADRQESVLASVGVQESLYSWTTAVDAAAVQLTALEAARLTRAGGVLAVVPDTELEPQTVSSPEFLGLSDGSADGSGGVWDAVGGVDEAGDGVVVGVIDTGYWPENPSFAGAKMPTAKKVTTAAPGPVYLTAGAQGGRATAFLKADGDVFTGLCQAGEQFSSSTCNDKVISARYFDTGFQSVKNKDRSDAEFISARDGAGHGSHTASTAAGNFGVDMSIEGRDFGQGSGMAPAAKIAVYKVCWEDNADGGGCYTSDSIAAINTAVQDGVDVINYSISGSLTTTVDAVEYAFFGAAAAGVFVAASAGNSGPTASTVAHNSPWVTTVAASTHVAYEGTVELGEGGELLKGASISGTGVPAQTEAVLSTEAGLAGADPEDVRLCVPGTLDPAVVAGTVVVCERGVIARVDKSLAVAQAGGVGMVLANTGAGQSLDADFHSVPTVHVDAEAGAAIEAWVAAGGTLALLPGNLTDDPTPTPQIAGFSSRGPALANDADLLKPDISAPGVSVIAAVAPPSNGGRDYDLYSGTSMSSPHVAGLAALYLGVHPQWSPASIKSAMMTTAYSLVDASGADSADLFDAGAGHVDPTRFFTPGLVVDADVYDWVDFYAGQGLTLASWANPISATDLNYPSIAISQLPGSQTVERTFTAVETGTWTVEADIPGIDVVASPSTVTFDHVGQEQTVAFTFTRTDAPLTRWAEGYLTLTGPQDVRMPVALRPVSVAAPAEVTGTGTSGSVDVEVTAGFTGDLPVTTAGLVAGEVSTGDQATGDYTAYVVEVPEDTAFARFDLDSADDAADLDLTVYRMNAAGTALVALAGQSASGSADERVDLLEPAAGLYYVVIDIYASAPGATTSAWTETDFLVPAGAGAGDLTVTPNPVAVTQGEPSTFSASWSGLAAGVAYLGLLGYEGALAPTMVSVG